MASQAEALCRCGLEALFTLGAVWRDEHTARELIRSDDALRLKLLRASETLGASGIAAPDPEREKARAQLIAELESQE
jgi:hypothetical protein